MSQGFLFRRLAPFIPCVFPHIGRGELAVASKYDVASIRDVFMSAHYWRLFDHLASPPELIVDLGAHCGHFSVLCHLAILERFGVDTASYILVEALPSLIPVIRRVVTEAGFPDQATIIEGLVGRKGGGASFETNPRNLLSSKVESAGKGRQLSYVDMDDLLPSDRNIDVLKIDIEGSEFDLWDNYQHIFSRARRLLVEVHGDIEKQLEFEQHLALSGLIPLSPTIVKEHERLLFYGSSKNGSCR